MEGIIFRLGIRLKDWGEQLKRAWLVGLGLGITDFVLRSGEAADEKIKTE
jgi:hypothetical protein